MSIPKKATLTIMLLVVNMIVSASPAWATNPVVRSVLFYSPSCGHCHHVIEEVLPPIQAQYGDSFQVILIDVAQPQGNQFYLAFHEAYEVPPNYMGVPAMVIGDIYLVGSADIPAQLPGVIEANLDSGVDWPPIPGLKEALAAQGIDTSPVTSQSTADRFRLDPVGNSLAVVVLTGLILVSILVAAQFAGRTDLIKPWPQWVIPVLVLAGLVVAGYLSYVEILQTEAVCGPVGDCNTVQQSQYAYLFGAIPIGALGLFGYVGILIAWFFQSFGADEYRPYASTLLWLMAISGTLFSIYLTFLEPFVIGATCAWCLSSAIIMALLLWATTPYGVRSFKQISAPVNKSTKPSVMKLIQVM